MTKWQILKLLPATPRSLARAIYGESDPYAVAAVHAHINQMRRAGLPVLSKRLPAGSLDRAAGDRVLYYLDPDYPDLDLLLGRTDEL